MSRIRVLVADASPWSVPNFYRTIGPLLAEPHRYEVILTDQAELTWVDLARCDIVCVPRVYQNDQLRIVEMAKAARKPVWVDYDDNLLEVPDSNPAYIEFSQPSARESILVAIQECDLVTASTQALVDVLQPARKDDTPPVVLLRNGLHPTWPARAATHNRSDTFYWRGSSSHIGDVLAYGGAIAEGLPESASFHMLGWFAWPLASQILNKVQDSSISFTKEMPINMYFRELENSGATCCVVPLEDSTFNRCKSNIAQLEALAVGALAIVPDWAEWDLPGAIKYTDQDSLRVAVAQYMETPYEARLAAWQQGVAAAQAQSALASDARYSTLYNLVYPGSALAI